MKNIENITVTYCEAKELVIELSKCTKKMRDYIIAWVADDDERTNSQWDILDEYSDEQLIKDYTHSKGYPYYIELDSIKVRKEK